MASTGTMAKQPAATGSTPGLLQAFLALIVVAAIGVGIVMATSNIAGPNAPAADQSYSQVEGLRGAAPLTGGPADRSFDTIEQLRGAATLSTVAANHSFKSDDQDKGIRGVKAHR